MFGSVWSRVYGRAEPRRGRVCGRVCGRVEMAEKGNLQYFLLLFSFFLGRSDVVCVIEGGVG